MYYKNQNIYILLCITIFMVAKTNKERDRERLTKVMCLRVTAKDYDFLKTKKLNAGKLLREALQNIKERKNGHKQIKDQGRRP